MRRGSRIVRWFIAAVFLVSVLCACGASGDQPVAAGGHLSVVAGEGVWGSLATQLGGDRVSVTSIVTDPNADPHEYESTSDDARAVANAGYVILNGAGYDDWGRKLLDASPSSSRTVLVVADLLGRRSGDNPHFWYSPAFVDRVVAQIAADLARIDPGDAAYFAERHADVTQALAPYHARVDDIRRHFAGQRVAATEDIFVYMADALGLDLISPPAFMQAIAEGNDPPAQAVAAFQQQITTRQAVVLVVNVQTATAVTTNIQDLAQQAGMPIVGVSETLQPPTATFQAWQLEQLTRLESALHSVHPGG